MVINKDSTEIDQEWFEEDETGGVVDKTIRYLVVGDGGVEKYVSKIIKVRVLSGIEYASYQDRLIRPRPDGEVDVDIKAGQKKLVQLSLGWSNKQVDTIKRKKPMACWSAIVEAVSSVNRVGSKVEVTVEKNGDGESSSPPSQ